MSMAEHIASMDREVVTHLHTGETIEVFPEYGDPVLVVGVFDRAFEVAESSGVDVNTSQPALFARLADLPADVSACKRVHVNGVRYRVTSFQPDGQGAAHLLLRKVDRDA